MLEASPAAQEIAASHDRTGPRSSLFHAHHSMLCTWSILLASGSTRNKFNFNPDKIAETARAAGLAVHPVTKARAKDEFLGVSL